MSSRYISISSLLWVSLFVLLFIFVKTGSTEQIKRVAGCVTIVFLVGVVTLDSLQWRAYFVSRHEQLQPAQAELLSLKNDDLLRRLTHTPDYLRNQAAILERLRLSVYRNR